MSDDGHGSVESYYDALSATYDGSRRSPYHEMLDDLAIEAALPYAHGADLLEVGCGTGRILSRLSDVAERAVGIDLSEGMLDKARARGLDVLRADACGLPFDDASFDFVCSFKTLAHVRDVRLAVAEAARVTRPGGHLVLEHYNPWSLRHLARRARGPRPIGNHRTKADVFTRWDSPPSVRALLPETVEVLGYRGARIVTPFAALHRIPSLHRVLRRAESRASRSLLRYFGGFLMVVLRKRGPLGGASGLEPHRQRL